MNQAKNPELKFNRTLVVKVDTNGYFNCSASTGPFLFKDCHIEILKLGDNNPPGLNVGDVGQTGVYRDSQGEYIIYFKHHNRFCSLHELAGSELKILPKPSRLEALLLALLNSWADPFYPWPFV